MCLLNYYHRQSVHRQNTKIGNRNFLALWISDYLKLCLLDFASFISTTMVVLSTNLSQSCSFAATMTGLIIKTNKFLEEHEHQCGHQSANTL